MRFEGLGTKVLRVIRTILVRLRRQVQPDCVGLRNESSLTGTVLSQPTHQGRSQALSGKD